MNEGFLKEKIGYYKTLVTLIWTGIFVVSSGIGWALINLQILKLYLVSTGILFDFALVMGFIFFDSRIRKLLKQLDKGVK